MKKLTLYTLIMIFSATQAMETSQNEAGFNVPHVNVVTFDSLGRLSNILFKSNYARRFEFICHRIDPQQRSNYCFIDGGTFVVLDVSSTFKSPQLRYETLKLVIAFLIRCEEVVLYPKKDVNLQTFAAKLSAEKACDLMLALDFLSPYPRSRQAISTLLQNIALRLENEKDFAAQFNTYAATISELPNVMNIFNIMGLHLYAAPTKIPVAPDA